MAAPSYILGISAFYHDSAACLLRDGTIVAAAQEERFSRRKGDAAFPARAVDYCLHHAGIRAADLSQVGFYDKPLLKFERILETYLSVAPRGLGSFLHAGPLWAGNKLDIEGQVQSALGYDRPILFAEHHESHAASAFYPSPFNEAAILTADGVGEWATSSLGAGRGADIEILKEMRFPDSLGLLYSAFTYYLGFRVNSGEHKVMGLAAYGEPRFVDLIRTHLVDLQDDGSFTLDQRYFSYVAGLTMTSEAFHQLFGAPPRAAESRLTQRDMDLARSIQAVCEEVMLRASRTLHSLTGLTNLCLAGGVALNGVANGRLLREGPFRNIWIQPAAGDAGGAIGVAQLIWHRHEKQTRAVPSGDGMHGALLGPSFTPDEIQATIAKMAAVAERVDDDQALLGRVAQLLAEERVVGWFDGRMEFGPRALGARSILGDPRSPRMQAQMNLKIKFREGFRPFAPSVLRERARDYFDIEVDSPYMLLVAPVRGERRLAAQPDQQALWGIDRLNVPRSDIPAVTHVDYSSRIQTVDSAANPRYYALLQEFERQTGYAVLVNTSFNVRGEPIVCTPADAYACFMRTNLDCLVMGPYLLYKDQQPAWKETSTWKQRPLD